MNQIELLWDVMEISMQNLPATTVKEPVDSLSHFNHDYTKLKMTPQIEHSLTDIQFLQKSTPNTNNNEPADKAVKKAIKRQRIT